MIFINAEYCNRIKDKFRGGVNNLGFLDATGFFAIGKNTFI